jgi:ribosomal protein S18 acetylase RimI-like enzyme
MTDALTLDEVREDDVAELARLHRAAFPGFFLSSLGEPFLATFYRGFLGDPTAVTVVARSDDGAILGAVVGTTAPVGFFRRLLRRRWFDFLRTSARTVLARPSIVLRLAGAVLYRGDPPPDDQSSALLSSICVAPSAQGRGVGDRLLDAWLKAAAAMGSPRAYLTTDAVDNEPVNRFYRDRGWVLTQTYATRHGRRMNRYTRGTVAR